MNCWISGNYICFTVKPSYAHLAYITTNVQRPAMIIKTTGLVNASINVPLRTYGNIYSCCWAKIFRNQTLSLPTWPRTVCLCTSGERVFVFAITITAVYISAITTLCCMQNNMYIMPSSATPLPVHGLAHSKRDCVYSSVCIRFMQNKTPKI